MWSCISHGHSPISETCSASLRVGSPTTSASITTIHTQNIPKASKTAFLNLLFICSLFDSVERGVQRGREKRTKIYITFTSKAVLQGLCSEAVLQGVLEKGSSMLLGIRKTGKCWTKVIFLQNMELKHQNPFHKKYCNPFRTSWNCIVLVKAGPRCLAGEFGHGLSSLPEPQGQNQGALGWKSRRRLGIPRSSGIGIKRRRGRILKMGEIFFGFFQKVRLCMSHIIISQYHIVMFWRLYRLYCCNFELQSETGGCSCNDYCNRIRLFSFLY